MSKHDYTLGGRIDARTLEQLKFFVRNNVAPWHRRAYDTAEDVIAEAMSLQWVRYPTSWLHPYNYQRPAHNDAVVEAYPHAVELWLYNDEFEAESEFVGDGHYEPEVYVSFCLPNEAGDNGLGGMVHEIHFWRDEHVAEWLVWHDYCAAIIKAMMYFVFDEKLRSNAKTFIIYDGNDTVGRGENMRDFAWDVLTGRQQHDNPWSIRLARLFKKYMTAMENMGVTCILKHYDN